MHLDKWKKASEVLEQSKCNFYVANMRHKKIFESFCDHIKMHSITYPFYPQVDINQSQDFREYLLKKYNFEDEDKLLIYAGRLSIQKNINKIFEILKKLPPSYKLLLCGGFDDIVNEQRNLFYIPGFYFNHLDREITEFNKSFSDRVIYAGSLDQDELMKHYMGADLYVSLSTYFLEDYGVAPMEAYACGLPLLLTDWGGYENFKSFENTLSLETYLSESSTAISLDLVEENIKEVILKANKSKHNVEIDTKINSNFLKQINDLLKKDEGEELRLSETQNNWQMSVPKDNLLFYKHFAPIASNKRNNGMISTELYIKSAKKLLINPRNDLLPDEIQNKFLKHYYNYFATPQPLFFHSLMETDKNEFIDDRVFLRNSKLSDSMIRDLIAKFPLVKFYYLGDQFIELTNFINCEMVLLDDDKPINPNLILSIDFEEGDVSEIIHFIKTNNYKKLYLLKNDLSYSKNLIDSLNNCINTNVISIQELKGINTEKFEFSSFYLSGLIGDSFIDYTFLSNGHIDRKLSFSTCDFKLSPYHGLKIKGKTKD